MELADTIAQLLALLGIAIAASAAQHLLRLPFSVLLVMIGMALGTLGEHWVVLETLSTLELTPELVLFLFLPVLIFESGYNLDARALSRNLGPVLVMAVLALLLSAAIVGFGLWWLLGIPLVAALLFGILISATDPVAVVALFRELGAPLRLTVLVEGESLFNDATALVGFHVILGLLVGGGSVVWLDAGTSFMTTFFGGLVVGGLAGLLLGELMRLIGERESVLALSLLLAYGAFILAEHWLHVSGVMATMAAALVLAGWGRMRMHRSHGETLAEVWEFLAWICNSLLFLLIGLSVSVAMLMNHLGAIALAIVLVLAGRAVGVFSLIPLSTRLFRQPAVALNDRTIIWWGGLKGGLAIAMALSIPAELPEHDLIMSMTAGVVLFTLFINAPTIRWLMHWMKLDRMTDSELQELHFGMRHAQQSAQHVLIRLRHSSLLGKTMGKRVKEELHQSLGGSEDGRRLNQQNDLELTCAALLRVEAERLEDLFDTGVAPQYALFDISRDLRLERERLKPGQPLPQWQPPAPPHRMFGKWAAWMREHDRLNRLLILYQNLRLARQVVLRMVRIGTTEAAIEALAEMHDLDDQTRTKLQDWYAQRNDQLRAGLKRLQVEFPDFYSHFAYNISKRASLSSALFHTRNAHEHGQIGGKVFHHIEKLVMRELDRMPALGAQHLHFSASELIEAVPLFSGLPPEALDSLAANADMVRTLPGEPIITQGQKGHALYVIASGQARVHLRENKTEMQVAIVHEGDFFGEIALLGERVRTSSVTAILACNLIRITRQQVLKLAKTCPEVSKRLAAARDERNEINLNITHNGS